MNTAKNRRQNKGGFTLIEICIAGAVLGLTVASSVVAMGIGFTMIESARDNALAAQILQSEMENLRLKSWEQLTVLDDGEFVMEESFKETAADRFTCLRIVDDTQANLWEITLRVEWNTSMGREVSVQYSSFFSKTGLNDYYYRAFH